MEASKYYKLINKLRNQKDTPTYNIDKNNTKEILQELDIYHAELTAQNEELIEKEQKLIDSKKEYELFFYDAPVAYLIIDKAFVIERYNKKADEFFRISLGYIKKKVLFVFFKSNSLEDFLNWISKEEYLEKPLEINMKFGSNGTRRFKMYGNNYPLNNDNILLSLIDIQEEYTLKNDLQTQVSIKTEENLKQYHILQQQSKFAAMGEMIANIAHQWRQPLNILSAYNIDILLKYKHNNLTEEVINNFSKKSQYLIEKMSSTIESFVNFFSPNKEKSSFKIIEVINETFTLIENSFKKHEITILLNCDKDITYNGHKNEFEQVILIILNNSRDSILSANKKGKINIDISSFKNQYINIEISDNGGGVDDEIIDRIFEPYFTTKHKSQGTGIGLYMSKMIIEQSMQGSIRVENYNEGLKTLIKLPFK